MRILVPFLLLALSAPVQADPSFRFSLSAGGFFGDTLAESESPIFETEVDIDESLWLEARFGVLPVHWVEIEGAVGYAPSEFVLDTGSSGLFGTSNEVKLADVDIWHFTMSGNFHIPTRSDFDPFITTGIGAATYDPDVAGVDADTKFAFVFGGGFNYWLSDVVGLRFDVKDYITILDIDVDEDYYEYDPYCGCYRDDSDSEVLNNVVVAGGLSFKFGD